MTAAILALWTDAQAFGGILARARSDRMFRSRLLVGPKDVLQEHGVRVPAGVELRAVNGIPGTTYLVLPQPPAVGEADDRIAGAATARAVNRRRRCRRAVR